LLLQERALGGRGEDLQARMDRWRHDRGQKAETARQMARGWAKRARSLVKPVDDAELPAGVLLAEGFPENLAKRRDARARNGLPPGAGD
jgi:ATP-dependent helicase HrpB